MAFVRGANVVTDGIIMNLDAGNSKSYPGTGTIMADLSNTSNSGSFLGSPIFSSDANGNLAFDGLSTCVLVPNTTSIQVTVGTISAWTKATSPGSSYRAIMAKQSAWGLFFLNSILVTYDWGNNQARSTEINIADGTWKHVAMTFTETVGTPLNNATIYLNGISILTTTVKHSSHFTQLSLASGTATTGISAQVLNGNISNAQVYNRALSAAEVLQNYNATKARFGIE